MFSRSDSPHMSAKAKITKQKFTYETNATRSRKQIKKIIESSPQVLENYDKQTLRRKLKDPAICVRGGFLQSADLVASDGEETAEVVMSKEDAGTSVCTNTVGETSSISSTTPNVCDNSETSKQTAPVSPWSPLAKRVPSSCSDEHDNDTFLRRDQYGHRVDCDGVVYISDDE